MKSYFKTRCAAIMLVAAGYGWAGGHYIPSNSNIFAYLFQFIVLGALLVLGVKFFSQAENNGHKWPVKALNVFSILSLLINILNIVHGAINTDPHSFGSHNTFADLVPIAILITGSGLWVITIILNKKKGTT